MATPPLFRSYLSWFLFFSSLPSSPQLPLTAVMVHASNPRAVDAAASVTSSDRSAGSLLAAAEGFVWLCCCPSTAASPSTMSAVTRVVLLPEAGENTGVVDVSWSFLSTRRGWRPAGGQEEWCISAFAGQDYFRAAENCVFPASRPLLLLIH